MVSIQKNIKRNEIKKEEEKQILNRFIDAYKEQIDNNATFRTLETEEARLIYPDYHGENPDFVVQFNGEYIGVELFILVQNELNKSNIEFTGINAKNLSELHALQEKFNDNSLLENDELVPAALDRLKDKFTKIDNYINCPIWFIGHVPRPYNIGLLSTSFDDKMQRDFATFIYLNLPKDERVAKIWLAEFRSKSFLLEIKEYL